MADRCTPTALACGEPVLGTASRARRWVLLEQPGPWGRDALTDSALPAPVATHLTQLSLRLPCRVLLLRRTGRGQPSGTARVLLAGVTSPDGGGWLERFHLDDPADVLDLDLGPLAHGRSVGGQRVDDPVYLVCTNGRHDPCCAQYGLPVARALDRVVGNRLWECSHVGGDRFAGNLVCLPDGVFYGHLDAHTAVQAVAAHDAGRVLWPHFRGRSSLPFVTQAAEALVRRELGLSRLADLRIVEETADGPDHRVRFALADGGHAVATVRPRRHPTARPLTCSTAPQAPPTYTLVDLRRDP